MSRTLISIAFVILTSTIASAQQPLSPPDKSPVPLTDRDQEMKRLEELNKKTGQVSPAPGPTPAVQVKVPVVARGNHISSGNVAIDAIVQEAAALHGIDPCLVLSVMRAESGFNRGAISPKGASGLMQLMPATAARFGVRNIFDPRENILAGTRYLRWLLDRFNGDVRLALAGYNAGEGAVEFYGLRIPPFQETQGYVRTIFSRYSAIHGASVPSPMPVTTPPPTATVASATTTTRDAYPTYNQIIKFSSSTASVEKK